MISSFSWPGHGVTSLCFLLISYPSRSNLIGQSGLVLGLEVRLEHKETAVHTATPDPQTTRDEMRNRDSSYVRAVERAAAEAVPVPTPCGPTVDVLVASSSAVRVPPPAIPVADPVAVLGRM
jgi:hypothetical protein